MRTLAEIRAERGESPHAFVLVITGVLSADPETAHKEGQFLLHMVDTAVHHADRQCDGMEVTSLALRVETLEVYKEAGLPNAG